MKMHFFVSYLMVILWVCYGYPMVLIANYPTILSTHCKFTSQLRVNYESITLSRIFSSYFYYFCFTTILGLLFEVYVLLNY